MHDLAHQQLAGWRLAEHVQPNMDLAVRDILDLRVEFGGVFGKGLFRILLCRLVELRLFCQRPNLFFEGRRLLAVLVREFAVLVEHLFQLRQLVECARLRHRRGQIPDEAGRGAPLRDDTLAGNRHQIRIDIREASKSDIGIAGVVEADGLSGQPFEIAVGADMDHRVGLEHLAQPIIERQILVRRRDGRVMVGPGRVHAVLPRGLHRHEDIAVHGARHEDISLVGKHNAPRRLSPLVGHHLPRRFRQRGEERRVLFCGKLLAFLGLRVGQKRQIVGGVGSHQLD